MGRNCQEPDIEQEDLLHLMLELGHVLPPTAMRTTEFAPASAHEEASTPPDLVPHPSESASVIYGPPQWARPSYTKGFAGADFFLQSDGTLRCLAGQPLYTQERNGSLRILYAARIGHCRACSLREQCQESTTTCNDPDNLGHYSLGNPLSQHIT